VAEHRTAPQRWSAAVSGIVGQGVCEVVLSILKKNRKNTNKV
jgi:hypothetical protein